MPRPRPVKHVSRWTDKERLWFERYRHHGNSAQAVREAGYDVDPHDYQGHARMGHEIVNRPHIKQAIAALGEELMARYALTPDNILGELVLIAKSNLADFYTIDAFGQPRLDLSKATRHELSSLLAIQTKTRRELGKEGEPDYEIEDVKIQLQPKVQALELLGKHLKLFTDRLEIEGSADPAAALQAARRRANLQIEQEKRDGSGDEDEG